MEYRILSHTGTKVSTIGIGSGSIHGIDDGKTVALFDFAEEKGINFIDMALSYPEPMERYGVALRGRREKFHLQMHLGITFESGEYGRDYNLEAVKRSFETQLHKTGSDYADTALFHCVDTLEDYNKLIDGGVFDYALAQKKAGVIRNLGFASHTVDIANRFIATDKIDTFMFSINAAYDFDPAVYDELGEDSKSRDSLTVAQDRQRLFQECAKRNIGITVMKAYGGGKLLEAKTSPFGRAMTATQCIQYALDRPAVLSCMLGIRDKADLEAAVKLFDATPEELDYSFISNIRPKEMLGSCVYCNHCMPCPAGINIGQTHKFFDLYLAGDEMAKEHYFAMERRASDCTQCGVCESRCPFAVNVREKMETTQQVMG
ncbi:MAG: aldo/keto reductase [Suipraeoptans sp.]